MGLKFLLQMVLFKTERIANLSGLSDVYLERFFERFSATFGA